MGTFISQGLSGICVPRPQEMPLGLSATGTCARGGEDFPRVRLIDNFCTLPALASWEFVRAHCGRPLRVVAGALLSSRPCACGLVFCHNGITWTRGGGYAWPRGAGAGTSSRDLAVRLTKVRRNVFIVVACSVPLIPCREMCRKPQREKLSSEKVTA